MNEILELIERLDASDEEHALFDAYGKARAAFFEKNRKFLRGELSKDELKSAYYEEIAALRRWIETRRIIVPE